jgi:SAM-dependent methyltransferase
VGGLWEDTVGELIRWIRAPRDPIGLAFDAENGTETRWFDLGNYEPSDPSDVDAVIAALDLDVSRLTFVDLGSGKGRAVLVAARRPFVRAVGIEHSGTLHAAALRNLEAVTSRGPLACPVHFFCGDAASHPLPDGPLLVYLYNPFGPEVVAKVLARLHGREVRIAYVNPLEGYILEGHGWIGFAAGGDGHHRWRLYRPP